MLRKGMPGTIKLVDVLVRRAIQLLRVAGSTTDMRDAYDALGMASSLIDEADWLLCTLPDEVLGIRDGVKEQKKTFEQLMNGSKVRAATA